MIYIIQQGSYECAEFLGYTTNKEEANSIVERYREFGVKEIWYWSLSSIKDVTLETLKYTFTFEKDELTLSDISIYKGTNHVSFEYDWNKGRGNSGEVSYDFTKGAVEVSVQMLSNPEETQQEAERVALELIKTERILGE